MGQQNIVNKKKKIRTSQNKKLGCPRRQELVGHAGEPLC